MIHGNNAIPAALIVDATTVGRAIVTVPNPGAVRYIRINADNTVSTLDAATFLAAIGGDTFDANHTITDDRTWTITGGKTLTITGGPVLFEGSSLTVETVGNTFGTNQTVISSSASVGGLNVITIRNADYTAGGAAGYSGNMLVSDYFTINAGAYSELGFIGDINADGSAFGLTSDLMTINVTNGNISGAAGVAINANLATMTGPWSFADGAGVSDSGAAGANWTFNAGDSGTPANDSLGRVTYTHTTADPNWRGLWLSINAPTNDGGSSSKDDSSYPRCFIAIEQSYDTGLGYRVNEFHCTLNDRRVFQFNVKDLDSNFASGGFAVPTTVGVPAANTSGEPALKVIDARPVSGDAMKAILWNQAATGTSGSVQVVMRGDQIGSDDGTHQNYWSILAGHEQNNTRSFSITDHLSGGGTRLYIKANGDIGIGNTAPTSKLDVTGTVTATAFVGTGTINSSDTITTDRTWTIATDKTLTITGGTVDFSGTSMVTSLIRCIGTILVGVSNSYDGSISFFNENNAFATSISGALATAARSIYWPDKDGTVALTSDVTAAVSDTAYDATSWNGVTTVAPSKNAVRDKIEIIDEVFVPLIFSTTQGSKNDGTSWTTGFYTYSNAGVWDYPVPAKYKWLKEVIFHVKFTGTPGANTFKIRLSVSNSDSSSLSADNNGAPDYESTTAGDMATTVTSLGSNHYRISLTTPFDMSTISGLNASDNGMFLIRAILLTNKSGGALTLDAGASRALVGVARFTVN